MLVGRFYWRSVVASPPRCPKSEGMLARKSALNLPLGARIWTNIDALVCFEEGTALGVQNRLPHKKTPVVAIFAQIRHPSAKFGADFRVSLPPDFGSLPRRTPIRPSEGAQ